MNHRLSKARKRYADTFCRPLGPEREIPEGLIWHVLITKQAREYKAARWLEDNAGAFTLVPLVTVYPRPKSGGKKKTAKPLPAQRPLLPRLVFAGWHPSMPPNWIQVESCLDLIDYLDDGQGRPAVARGHEIVRLRDNSEAARRQTAPQLLQVGSRARFVEPGVYGHQLVQIKALRGKYAVLDQMLFGREIQVALEKLEAA